MTRSVVREQIFRLLFRIEFNDPSDMPEQVRMFLDEAAAYEDKEIDIPEEDKQYIRNKYDAIVADLADIDARIEGASKGWSLKRIGKVELSILRLAVYEMLYDDDIPVGVAIDEAVELTKKYGQDASPAFVNGVLAAIAK